MSRTELGIALLLMGLLLFYAALLDARATDAQTGGGSSGESTGPAQTQYQTQYNQPTITTIIEETVIRETIPNKPLPDTGGSTVLMVGGSVLLLLYGGLVAWRLKTRER